MPIRFEYPAAAGMIGAYASGMAEATGRKRKYFQDLWQQERQHQMRMEELGIRAGARQSRLGAGGLGQAAGTWTDPLADDPARGTDIRILARAQRQRRDRLIQAGKEVPAEWRQTFTPAPTKEQVRFGMNQQMEKMKHQQRMELMQAQQLGRGDATARSKLLQVSGSLPTVPPHATADQKNELGRLAGFIGKMGFGNVMDWNDQDHWDKLQQAVSDYYDILGSIPPLDPNNQTWVRDKDTKQLVPTPEGQMPEYEGPPGQIKETPGYTRKLDEEKKAKEKAEEEKKTAVKELEDRRTKLQDDIRQLRIKSDEGVEGAETTKVKEEMLNEIRDIERQLKSLLGIPPAELPPPSGVNIEDSLRPTDEPGTGGYTPAEVQRKTEWDAAFKNVGAAAQKPIPAGMPAGTTWAGPNALRLPDGRIIVPDGA